MTWLIGYRRTKPGGRDSEAEYGNALIDCHPAAWLLDQQREHGSTVVLMFAILVHSPETGAGIRF